MKQFLAFVRKEFYHIFRDARTMLILLGMPIVQILLFGFAITTEIKNIPFAVFDMSKDDTTEQIVNKLQSTEYFSLVENIDNYARAEQIMKEGDVSMVLIFGSEFNEDMHHLGSASIQVMIDATDPNQATTINNYVSSVLAEYQQMEDSGYRIIPQVKMLYNPQLKGAYNFLPGVMGLIMMLICTMMTSIAIVREKERGNMEVLLASPIQPILIIIAKAVPYFTLSIVNLTTILLLSVYVLDVPIVGSLGMIIFASLIFILVALLLGLLISSLVNSQVTAMLFAGMGLMAPTMFLSGMMFPIDSMPAILQWVSSIMPARWYIEIIKKLMIQGVDSIYVIKEFAVLIMMIVVLLVINLKKFKVRL